MSDLHREEQRIAELTQANAQLRQELVERQHAEHELHVVRQFAEEAELGFGVGDLDGTIRYVNRTLCRLMEADSPEQVVGGQFQEYYPQEWEEQRAKEVLPALEKEGHWEGELTLRSRHGKLTSTWHHIFLLRDENRKPYRRAIVVTNITERKRAELALRQSHDELRAMYDGMFDGLMIWDRETWKPVQVNPALCRMSGYSESELLSQQIMDLHPKEEFPAIERTIRARIEGHFRGVSTVTFLQKNGNLTYAEVVSHPLTSHGRPCFASFFRDVTERQLTEMALRDSEERVRTICDSAMDAVLMLDHQGRTLYWNPAAERMFGYSAQEMLGQEVHAILTGSPYREQAQQAFSRFAATGHLKAAGKTLELTALRKDGQEFPVEISISAFRLHGKWGAAAIIRDVTERKRTRDRLERDRRTLERMLRASDHERQLVAYDIHDGLAQHLAGALMQFDVYRFMKDRDPQRAEVVYQGGMAMLRQSHAEARRLISGLRPPILDEFGVVAAITHLVHDLEATAGGKIAMHCRVQFSRLSPVLENTIYRIVQEGLTNAVKHSQSSRFRVSLIHQADRIRMTIRDWGIGFVPQKRREDQFGLKGIRERTRLLGGKYRLRSRPGEGTSIRVELPVVEAEEA